jgi:hypothetical protein
MCCGDPKLDPIDATTNCKLLLVEVLVDKLSFTMNEKKLPLMNNEEILRNNLLSNSKHLEFIKIIELQGNIYNMSLVYIKT